MRRAALLLAPLAVLVTGCSEPDEVDAGDSPRDAGFDAGSAVDAGFDAGFDGGLPPPGDSCRDFVDVNVEGTVDMDGVLRIVGSNVAARDDEDFCGRFTGTPHVADVVYRYTAPEDGQLAWDLEDRGEPTRFDVDVRTGSCDDVMDSIDCQRCDVSCMNEGRYDVTAGQELFFVIAGVTTVGNRIGMGELELALHFERRPMLGDPCDFQACPAMLECQDEGGARPVCGTCGDGYLRDELLACDDGNTVGGDGCSSDCMLDTQGGGAADCGAPATLNLVLVSGAFGTTVRAGLGMGTMTAGSDLSASCGGGAGDEAVYRFDLPVTADLDISVMGADVVSLLTESAGCAGTPIACVTGDATGISLAPRAVAPGAYLLVIDRDAPTSAPDGSYSVDIYAREP